VADALGHVLVWFHALKIQAQRIESAENDMSGTLGRDIDLRFFAVALRNLLRSAKPAAGGAAEQIEHGRGRDRR
jgi:hypothetical protein